MIFIYIFSHFGTFIYYYKFGSLIRCSTKGTAASPSPFLIFPRYGESVPQSVTETTKARSPADTLNLLSRA